MVALKKKEILTELKKFGIDTTSERKFYLREYKNYYTLQNHHVYSHQEDNRVVQGHHIYLLKGLKIVLRRGNVKKSIVTK